MNFNISKAFVKDAAILPPRIKQVLSEVIKEIQFAYAPEDIKDCTRLKGTDDLYRIRRGVYRITFQYENDTVTLTRVLPRGQIYKKHNLR